MTVLKADPNTRNLLGREGLQERDSHGRNYRRQPGREILRVLTESQTVKNSGGGGGAFLTKRTRCPYTKTADRHGGGSIRPRGLSAWLQACR